MGYTALLDRIAHEAGTDKAHDKLRGRKRATVTSEAANRLDEFFGAFTGEKNSLLLLDYDGTLAPFRVDRFTARPWAGVRELLDQIQRQGRTRMVVITGRPVKEIAPMLGLNPALEVWGLHGAERLYPDGRRELEAGPAVTQAKLEELRESLRRDSLGGLFEDKANGVVMHWRGVSPSKARQIEQRTRALFEPLAQMDGLALLDFEAGLELRLGRNKGGAVEAILAEYGTGGPAAYLGDDLSDEAAFRAMKGRGLSALVLKEFLARWAKEGSGGVQAGCGPKEI
jgi:trehalose 6-phosphate phosphatase